jgi:fumarylacetoacetate (FAA) hydrolase family protein
MDGAMELSVSRCLPRDLTQALLVGRVWLPDVGPTACVVKGSKLCDLSTIAPTVSQLLELADPVTSVRSAPQLAVIADLAAALANSDEQQRDPSQPWLLAPCDLQAIKAAGVTFVASMLERVIEEQARGDASKAASVRSAIVAVIGDNLASIRPGSDAAMQLKRVLIAQGAWSQYLEVGIGPDAEVFTKSQPMSAVGVGADIGIHPKSEWSNPEPEIVLAVNSQGRVVGATLGNDVNLRDFEGRSALLLGKAKDNNASCAIGPFIRLFDDHYSIDDVRSCDLSMRVAGLEGFVMTGSSSLSKISRDPLDLVGQTINASHQYPDGFMLFLGTMFAPTQDRGKPGLGFTHAIGDIATVATPMLGSLSNRVNTSDKVAPWTFGVTTLMKNLAGRGLLR